MKIYNTNISVPMKYDRIFLFVSFRSSRSFSFLFSFLIVTIREIFSANDESKVRITRAPIK